MANMHKQYNRDLLLSAVLQQSGVPDDISIAVDCDGLPPGEVTLTIAQTDMARLQQNLRERGLPEDDFFLRLNEAMEFALMDSPSQVAH